jgi:hypothetical protein
MQRICGPILVLAMLLSARAAEAEVLRPFVGFGIGYGVGYGGYGYGYGGGTAAGNYMYGMSNVIRAEGQYNLLTSMAGVNNEEARSKYLDNKKKWQENYLQGQEQHQKMEAERFARSKHSSEALAAAATSDLPRKLSPDALDPVTGRITWPEALLADDYAAPRKELEQLFELRAKTTHTAGTSEKIRAATARLSDMLRKNIQNIPANEYVAARKFLDNLAWSAR